MNRFCAVGTLFIFYVSCFLFNTLPSLVLSKLLNNQNLGIYFHLHNVLANQKARASRAVEIINLVLFLG